MVNVTSEESRLVRFFQMESNRRGIETLIHFAHPYFARTMGRRKGAKHNFILHSALNAVSSRRRHVSYRVATDGTLSTSTSFFTLEEQGSGEFEIVDSTVEEIQSDELDPEGHDNDAVDPAYLNQIADEDTGTTTKRKRFCQANVSFNSIQ